MTTYEEYPIDPKLESLYKDVKKDHPDIDHMAMVIFMSKMKDEATDMLNGIKWGKHIGSASFYEDKVKHLHNPNGTKGPKWDVKTLENLSGIRFDHQDYYALDYALVANYFYAEFSGIFTEPTYYLQMAKRWLESKNYKGDPSERAYLLAQDIPIRE